MVNNNNGFPDPKELVRKQRKAHKKESLKTTLATWKAEAKFKKPATLKRMRKRQIQIRKKGIKQQLDEAYIEAFIKKQKQAEKEQEKAILAKKKKVEAKKKAIRKALSKKVRFSKTPARVAKKYLVGKRLTFKIGRVR
tara:strand:- start:255 stop:668 length:414 start_codon:yes stop_codon:yes gene_type:complete